jgi:hypothetical protein
LIGLKNRDFNACAARVGVTGMIFVQPARLKKLGTVSNKILTPDSRQISAHRFLLT